MSLPDISNQIAAFDVVDWHVKSGAFRAALAALEKAAGGPRKVEDLSVDEAMDALEVVAGGSSGFARALDALTDAEFRSFAKVFRDRLADTVDYSTTVDVLTENEIALALKNTAAKLKGN